MRILSANLLLLGCFVLSTGLVIAAEIENTPPKSTSAADAKSPAAPAATEHPPGPLELAPNTVVTRDLVYAGEDSNDKAFQSLDVYAPRDAKGLPVVLFVHGGGWNHGSRAEVASQPKFFNSHGIVLVSVDYRLSPPHQHPAPVEDLASAIAWVQKNIGQYGGDGKKLVIMGHSAGSHLVSLVATDPRYLAKHGLQLSDLRGTISLDGSAFDIVERIAKGGEKLAENCRRAFGSDPSTQADASPLNHVKNGAGIAPFLLVYVKPDSLNHAQSKAFGEKLTANDAKSELLQVDGKDHFSLLNDVGASHDAVGDAIVKFIAAVTAS